MSSNLNHIGTRLDRAIYMTERVDGLTGEVTAYVLSIHNAPGVWTFAPEQVPTRVRSADNMDRWIKVQWLQEADRAIGAVEGYGLSVVYDARGGIKHAVFAGWNVTDADRAANPDLVLASEAAEAAAARDDDALSDARDRAARASGTAWWPHPGAVEPTVPNARLGNGKVVHRRDRFGTLCWDVAASERRTHVVHPTTDAVTCSRCLRVVRNAEAVAAQRESAPLPGGTYSYSDTTSEAWLSA